MPIIFILRAQQCCSCSNRFLMLLYILEYKYIINNKIMFICNLSDHRQPTTALYSSHQRLPCAKTHIIWWNKAPKSISPDETRHQDLYLLMEQGTVMHLFWWNKAMRFISPDEKSIEIHLFWWTKGAEIHVHLFRWIF